MKRVIYFSKTDRKGPSSRYRIYQFLPGLKEAGISVKVSPLFRKAYFTLVEWPLPLRLPGKFFYTLWRFLVRALHLPAAAGYDAVVIEHQLFPYLPPWIEGLLPSFTLEFDDAIYLTRFHGKKMKALTRMAKHVIVGNRFLADYARGQNENVSIVPTVVDLSRYEAKSDYSIKAGQAVVGWVGLRYNFSFLHHVAGALPEGASLRVVSSNPPPIKDLPLEFVQWTESDEARIIAGFDVGIMPLPDNEWARGKCALKALQYMAAGVPVVASPVGINLDIIEDGVNGFLAADEDEWQSKIKKLLTSESLRESMGRAGRRTVEAAFTRKHGLELLKGIYEKI